MYVKTIISAVVLVIATTVDGFISPRGLVPDECGLRAFKLQLRIAGGIETDPYDNPWAALLMYHNATGSYSICGGSLIADRYVLTAAHCVGFPLRKASYSVRLGDWNTRTEMDCSRRKCRPPHIQVAVERVIIHESYTEIDKPFMMYNDIALLRLARSVEFTHEVRPICLPSTSKIPRNMTVIGWGKTGYNKKRSDVLLGVSIPFVDQGECNRIVRQYRKAKLIQSQFCGGGEKGKSTCKGDSGGPVMGSYDGVVRDESDPRRRVIVGIVSHSLDGRCSTPGVPKVFTKVSSYVNWILENIQKSAANRVDGKDKSSTIDTTNNRLVFPDDPILHGRKFE